MPDRWWRARNHPVPQEEKPGEEDLSESDSYGSMDFMEGNEDLSSNRGDQSFAGDQDMHEDH